MLTFRPYKTLMLITLCYEAKIALLTGGENVNKNLA